MRVKVCFDCKKVCHLAPGTYVSIVAEKVFDSNHRGHRVQILTFEEFVAWKEKNKDKVIIW